MVSQQQQSNEHLTAAVAVLSAGLQQVADNTQATADSMDELSRNAAMEAARP